MADHTVFSQLVHQHPSSSLLMRYISLSVITVLRPVVQGIYSEPVADSVVVAMYLECLSFLSLWATAVECLRAPLLIVPSPLVDACCKALYPHSDDSSVYPNLLHVLKALLGQELFDQLDPNEIRSMFFHDNSAPWTQTRYALTWSLLHHVHGDGAPHPKVWPPPSLEQIETARNLIDYHLLVRTIEHGALDMTSDTSAPARIHQFVDDRIQSHPVGGNGLQFPTTTFAMDGQHGDTMSDA